MEFFKLLKDLKERRDRLQERYARAQRMMDETRALESDLRIRTAALAVQEGSPVTLDVRNVAGVRLPEITVRESEPPVYPSLMIQELGKAYTEVVESILQLAARETALRKMLIEIKKTKRRANALEHMLLPKLERSLSQIRNELEEREREEFSQLKQRKK